MEKKKLLLVCVLFVGVLATLSAQFEEGVGFVVDEEGVFAVVDGNERHIGSFGFRDDPFFGFGAVYSISPDRRAVAFIGEEKGGNFLYVFRTGDKFSDNVPASGDLSWLSKPVWSPDSRFIAFSMGGRIWVYELASDRAWIAAPETDGIEYLQDIDPEFMEDGETIRFYRGEFFDFQFGGYPFETYVYGAEPVQITINDAKYPPIEYFLEQYMDEPYFPFDPEVELRDLKIQLFIEDLITHNHSRLFLHFDPYYVNEQRYTMEAYGEGLTIDVFNSFFFNGAVMYTDYKNTISDLYEITDVLHFEHDPEMGEVFIVVLLRDGREVSFSIMIDPTTYLFFGAFG